MEVKTLKKLLKKSWTADTCIANLKEAWSSDNPSLGQSDVTALIVNDYFGGKIMRVMTTNGPHYYNLINNKVVDLTVEQFDGEIPEYQNGEERTRAYLLSNEDTKKRYILLLNNLDKAIDNDNTLKIIRELETRKEKMHQMGTTDEYINWLITFTKKNPYIDDYPDLMYTYMSSHLTNEDLKNIKDLNLFFATIDDYVSKNDGQIFRNNGKNYYLIKYKKRYFEIGFIPGQGGMFYALRELPKEGSIDFEDIITYNLMNLEEAKKKTKNKEELWTIYL